MEATLQAERREQRGKNDARRLRARGRIPGVLYGGGSDGQRGATPIAVDPKELSRILHSESGANTLIGLTVAGDAATRVLVKDYQLDPVTHQLLHADFYRVAMDKELQVTVPVLIKGEARGVKQQGALLDFVHRDIEIECLPGDIPEHIEIDVSELMLGQAIRVRDIGQGAKWRPISDPDTMLVHVVAPKAEEAAPAEAAAVAVPGAAAEPEVIKKGKAEKTEEE